MQQSSAEGIKTIRLPTNLGKGDGWGDALELSTSWECDDLIVDASDLGFAVPMFIIRLRAFLQYHLARGIDVCLHPPRSIDVANYLARMRLGRGLPEATCRELPSIREHDRSDVLIPLSEMRQLPEVDKLVDATFPLIDQSDDVAMFADALVECISEFCGNGVEHGRSDFGCYAAAQRYRGKTLISIGDPGIGIPTSVRSLNPELMDDCECLIQAIQEGYTSTGEQVRGIGFQSAMDACMASHIEFVTIRIRSGAGVLTWHAKGDGSSPRSWTREAPNCTGTWLTVELGPADIRS